MEHSTENQDPGHVMKGNCPERMEEKLNNVSIETKEANVRRAVSLQSVCGFIPVGFVSNHLCDYCGVFLFETDASAGFRSSEDQLLSFFGPIVFINLFGFLINILKSFEENLSGNVISPRQSKEFRRFRLQSELQISSLDILSSHKQKL